VGVGDLLHLQRPLEGDGVGQPVPEAVQVIVPREGLGEARYSYLRRADRLLDQARERVEHRGGMAAHPQGEVQERERLVEERLRRRDTDLVAAGQGEVGTALPHQGRADDVDEGEGLQSTPACCLQGEEDILRLPTLAHEHPHVVSPHCRHVLGDELGGEDGDRRPARQARDVRRPKQARVVARPTPDQVQVPCRLHPLHQRRHMGGSVVEVEHLPRPPRLLVDLLEHEVREPALLRFLHRLRDRLHLPLDPAPILDPPQLDPPRLEDHDLPILDPHDAPGEGEERGEVGGHHGDPISDPGDEPGSLLERVEPVLPHPPNHERVIPREVVVRVADRIEHREALVHVPLDGVDACLAIVRGANDHPLADERLSQLNVVHDVPVVSANEVAVRVEVGLGIGLRRSPERGPAELDDPPRPAHLVESEAAGDVLDPPHILAQVNLAVGGQGGAPDGVVPAVGEALPRLDEERTQGLVLARHDAEDAAHPTPLAASSGEDWVRGSQLTFYCP